jgi:ADP-ribosyl-[dinitrogen reductase] hydrolase
LIAQVGDAERRIYAGLTAFACGDAAGVPWETMRPDEIDIQTIPLLPQRRGWPSGAISDDTIFLLSTARTLVSGEIAPRALLRRLAADLPLARGAGRTSRAAIERFLRTGVIRATNGATNGAAMRALPIGWASAVARADERVRVGIEFARATHGEPSAILAAVAVAAMGAWSVEGAPIDQTTDRGLAEARVALSLLGVEAILLAPIECAIKDAWHPPPNGVPFAGIETVAAVITVLRAAQWIEDCIIRAVRLGGDTDTTAAIAAGIFAAWRDTPVVSWRDEVPFLRENDLAAIAQQLARRRFM